MNKKKILFYGNCQFRWLAETFKNIKNFDDHYEIIKSNDYNLINQGDENVVSNFLISKVFKSKNEYKLVLGNLNAALAHADILIFQSYSQKNEFGDGFTTDSIINDFEGDSICIPSLWFSGYLQDNSSFPMLDVFIWLRNHGKSQAEIIKFLATQNHQIFYNLIDYNYKMSMDGLKQRKKEQSSKYNYLCTEKWIEDNWEKTLISFNHSHQTSDYTNFIHIKLIEILKMSELEPYKGNFDFFIGGPDGHFYPNSFKFFRDRFPEISKTIKKFRENYDCWGSYSSRELGIYTSLGIKAADKEIEKLNNDCYPTLKSLKIIENIQY